MKNAFSQPKAYGGLYEDEPDKTIVTRLPAALNEEEEATEFAKYYHMGAVEPSKELMDMLRPENELDASAAFMPEEYVSHIIGHPESFCINGFCLMENGVAFAAIHTIQAGVNDENTDYFNKHFANGTGDLFYKVWCPGMHYRFYPDMAIEDMGWGRSKVRITRFPTKEDFGIDFDPAEQDPQFIDFQAMNLIVLPADAPDDAEPLRLMETNYIRQTEEGREIVHRFWLGIHMVDGKSVLYPIEDKEKASLYIRNIAHHSGNEFATLTRNIVEFYKDHHCE